MNASAPARESFRGGRSRLLLPTGPLAGFGIKIVAVLVIAALSFVSLQSAGRTAARVTHTFEVLDQLRDLLSTIKDAETAQRGFLLTGAETYLEPYTGATFALPRVFGDVATLVSDSPAQSRRLEGIQRSTNDKMRELGQTIELKRAGDDAGALAVVRTDRGKESMDRIRTLIGEMQDEERGLLIDRQLDSQNAARISLIVTWGGSALLLFLIVASAVMTSRDFRARETQVWLRTGQMGLSLQLQGDQRLDQLGEKVLAYLAEFLDAQVGALYIAESTDRFRRVAGYAVAGDSDVARPGDGLLGQALKENRTIHVRNVPDEYLPVASGVGRGKPKELLVAPAAVDGVVNAILELGFFRELAEADLELLARVSEALGVAIRSSKDRTRLEELLEETQRQGEELQTQQEELRVTNEELEVQSRSLQESQVRLEHQQAELEQTNSQLEEQAQMLEMQRDELSRTETLAVDRAVALEKSNQYKSEFLANMSHELRTPLNSTLILARILADNKSGNLSDEQVKYAETISSAGNDLLALINDILDLSKIESGKVDVVSEPLLIERTVDTLVKSIKPLADEKGLKLTLNISPGVPDRMETDSQRLGQILKNLLSNALKFTASGEVSLTVRAAPGDTLAFAVRDTGIGIDATQQDIIFEAFRQADGSTHRKYGGTGLGLSISRDLARLLGGDISVQSTLGAGSEFTLTLPIVYRASPASQTKPSTAHRPQPVVPERKNVRAAATRTVPAEPFTMPPATIEDDRHQIPTGARVILVVEDDSRFAAILRDMAHDMGFKCVITPSANEALAVAGNLVPDAILLDMQLPDHSGLGVLDQLKRNPLTRHIPVHVISVADLSQEALELGAVGYALKPIQREQLIEAFGRLESKLVQGVRRVLVIEDDERQRSSIEELLADDDVEITGVRSAAEALRKLQDTTFDCVVMDLNLPDLSGYELLKSMAEQEEVSFPPVIIYTGRSLTRDEELQLRKFSRSIIIKDARSPERLLDEVTLFLHRVESKLPPERQRMLKVARDRDATLEGRRVLIVEDDVRNVFALSTVLESRGAQVEIARNGREAIEAMTRSKSAAGAAIDLILMDIMMPEMDGFTAMREIRSRPDWSKVPIIALTAKAMKDDQEKCLESGANDYIAKPLDVEKLLSLIRVWMPK
ncbi:MAG: response regulator [Steroidobacteraceae bacterium]